MPAETINRALMLEQKREWKRRQSLQGKFEASFVSLDAMTDRIDPSKLRVLSDHGAGAEAIVDAIDGTSPETVYQRRMLEARKRLIKSGHRDWLEVLKLVERNGSNRKASIWSLMSRKAPAGSLPRCVTGGPSKIY